MNIKLLLKDGNPILISGFKELHYQPFSGDEVVIDANSCSTFSISKVNSAITVIGNTVVSIRVEDVKAVLFTSN